MNRSMMASQHRWIYIGSIVLLIVMLVVGLFTFSAAHTGNAANRKAQDLVKQLTAAGYDAPDQGQIARTLGTDGGVVCKDPNSALKQALWLSNLSNGAGGPGQRPVIADQRVLDAGAVVVEVYCPDELATYQKKINDLKTGKTVEDD
ncbi:hypothetical protein ACEZCY_17525 [Streptacidiphilus sp. N1-12]|uniref:Uncharacterized protein n=2 Tax=Streptacidiphilus alkalitolerans TaxID=3342712 RepID=A0ABV6WGA9_9ACTN